jgi:4a-hydroxytetrahydrobiopterin dehydratase
MSDLSQKKCVPCEGGIPPLSREKAEAYLKEMTDWKLSPDGKSIRAEYLMKDFMSAVELVNAAARVAESEDHHPDIHLTGYRKLAIELSTHAIGGLSENDFILAAKIDKLPKKPKLPKNS